MFLKRKHCAQYIYCMDNSLCARDMLRIINKYFEILEKNNFAVYRVIHVVSYKKPIKNYHCFVFPDNKMRVTCDSIDDYSNTFYGDITVKNEIMELARQLYIFAKKQHLAMLGLSFATFHNSDANQKGIICFW